PPGEKRWTISRPVSSSHSSTSMNCDIRLSSRTRRGDRRPGATPNLGPDGQPRKVRAEAVGGAAGAPGGPYLGTGAVALLVLLPAPARARIVAADTARLIAHDRRARLDAGLRARRGLEDHFPLARLAPLFFLALFLRHRLEEEQVPDDLLLDPVLHLGEQLEGLALVLDQRVLLPVGAQADALLE